MNQQQSDPFGLNPNHVIIDQFINNGGIPPSDIVINGSSLNYYKEKDTSDMSREQKARYVQIIKIFKNVPLERVEKERIDELERRRARHSNPSPNTFGRSSGITPSLYSRDALALSDRYFRPNLIRSNSPPRAPLPPYFSPIPTPNTSLAPRDNIPSQPSTSHSSNLKDVKEEIRKRGAAKMAERAARLSAEVEASTEYTEPHLFNGNKPLGGVWSKLASTNSTQNSWSYRAKSPRKSVRKSKKSVRKSRKSRKSVRKSKKSVRKSKKSVRKSKKSVKK